MNFIKNLSIAKRVSLALAIMITILLISNGLVFLDLNNVINGSGKVSNVFIPSTSSVFDIKNHTQNTVFNMRGYVLSQDIKYIGPVKSEIKQLKNSINETYKIAENTDQIDEEELGRALTIVTEYEDLVNQTQTITNKMKNIANNMNSYANAFEAKTSQYMTSQSETINTMIDEGADAEEIKNSIRKIDIMNEIISLENTVRINNFKFQATNNYSDIERALEVFAIIEKSFNTLLSTTKNDYEMDQLGEISDAISKYKIEIEKYLSEIDSLEIVNTERESKREDLFEITDAISNNNIISMTSLSNANVSSVNKTLNLLIAGL
jgi:hypothetical protein